MAFYEDTHTTDRFTDVSEGTTGLLVVDALGGSVTLSCETEENNWVVVATYDADGAYRIEVKGARWRFTPSDGAAYSWTV